METTAPPQSQTAMAEMAVGLLEVLVVLEYIVVVLEYLLVVAVEAVVVVEVLDRTLLTLDLPQRHTELVVAEAVCQHLEQ